MMVKTKREYHSMGGCLFVLFLDCRSASTDFELACYKFLILKGIKAGDGLVGY
jgi:hypothetical protein